MIRFIEQRFDLAHLPFYVNGIGIHEPAAPAAVNRPGTGDWMLMLFHTPCLLKFDGTPEPYPENTFCLWGPHDHQYYGNPEKRWEHSWIHIQGRLVKELFLNDSLFPCSPVQLADPSFFTDILTALYKEARLQTHPDALIQENLFQNLLRSIARDLFQNKPPPPEKLLQSKIFIDRHAGQAHTLKELAAHAGMSVPHYCAQFKKHFGMSPIDYSIHQRLQNACYLLSDPARSIGSIAEQTGYNDIYQFSRQFKKMFGLSPRNCRAQTIR